MQKTRGKRADPKPFRERQQADGAGRKRRVVRGESTVRQLAQAGGPEVCGLQSELTLETKVVAEPEMGFGWSPWSCVESKRKGTQKQHPGGGCRGWGGRRAPLGLPRSC